jgi:hypothetical protein
MGNELVLVSSRDDDRDARHDSPDLLGIELDAMSTIGRTLDAIEDPALRRRILNWAIERWGGDRSRGVNFDAPSRAAASTHPTSDPALSVDSIGELFGERPAGARPTTPAIIEPQPAAKAPVESMLQSLAADFQRLADEWNGDAKT